MSSAETSAKKLCTSHGHKLETRKTHPGRMNTQDNPSSEDTRKRGEDSLMEVHKDPEHNASNLGVSETLDSHTAMKITVDWILSRFVFSMRDLFRLRAASRYCLSAVQSRLDKAKTISLLHCPPWLNSQAFTVVALTNRLAVTVRIDRDVVLEHDILAFLKQKKNLALLDVSSQPISSALLRGVNECCPNLTHVHLLKCSSFPEDGLELLARSPMLKLKSLRLLGNRMRWSGLQLGRLITDCTR